MIYFAQTPTGSIKIGHTGDVDVRLDQLKSHYGDELALLATMPGDREREAEIHDQFAHLRFGRTEQFKPGADLMAFIGKPLLVDANPDAVEAARPVPGMTTRALRMRQEYADWLDDLAKYDRSTVAGLIDRALAHYGKAIGFGKEASER